MCLVGHKIEIVCFKLLNCKFYKKKIQIKMDNSSRRRNADQNNNNESNDLNEDDQDLNLSQNVDPIPYGELPSTL